MSDVWRIFVVEGDENLNQHIVSALRKEGYLVQGVSSGADAVRVLWSEEYDIVICDLKAPNADGFELLQWLRGYRPKTRMVMIGGPSSSVMRMQALECGAVSYLEKPLDLRILKEELRRLLHRTGFSANLASFDLLDVVQFMSVNRKNIALLVNTGVEERGVLLFQNGELVWADYGTLRGEEAFFALAAHKNGTVTQQAWNDVVSPNVTQPLSRLIMQALQYRNKYASPSPQPAKSEQEPPVNSSILGEIDDTPFVFIEEPQNPQTPRLQDEPVLTPTLEEGVLPPNLGKEWWQHTGDLPMLGSTPNGVIPASIESSPTISIDGRALTDGLGTILPAQVQKTPMGQSGQLPSWLIEQPTASDLPAVRPSSLSSSVRLPSAPPVKRSSSPEWQPPPMQKRTDASLSGQVTGAQRQMTNPQQRQGTSSQRQLSKDTGVRPVASPEWQVPVDIPQDRQSGALESLSQMARGYERVQDDQNSGPISLPPGASGAQARLSKRNYNYAALVSALQTLGYSLPGFIAAAVVNVDGQPIAQVAVDDLDLSRICKHFCAIMSAVAQSLDQGSWGGHEDTVITSTGRHIILRLINGEKNIFQVLITTREADPVESLGIMVNVEGAISSALYQSREKVL